MRFTKVRAGWWATPDGVAAVIVDCTGEGEWGAVVDPDGNLRTDQHAGETLDWFNTKREAVAACVRHAGE